MGERTDMVKIAHTVSKEMNGKEKPYCIEEITLGKKDCV